MEAFLENHRAWIESVVGCPRGEALTFEFDFPFSHVVLEQLMEDVQLDRQCLGAADALRPMVRRWETPPRLQPPDRSHRIAGQARQGHRAEVGLGPSLEGDSDRSLA